MANREKADRLTIKMPADLMRRVETIAASMELTSDVIIEMAVDRLVRAHDPRAAIREIIRESGNSTPLSEPAK
jgi:predicted transcriptional regulator